MSEENIAETKDLQLHVSQREINEKIMSAMKLLAAVAQEHTDTLSMIKNLPDDAVISSSPEGQAMEIDYDELGRHIDHDEMAERIDHEEISECLERGDFKSIVVCDVANYYGEQGIADAVAESIDLDEVTKNAVECIDYHKLAQAIVLNFMSNSAGNAETKEDKL